MNTKTRILPTRFEEPTRFDAPVPFRGIELDALERLTQQLLSEALGYAQDAEEPAALRRAANDAAALAAATAHPLLLFPCLFEEKVGTARAYARRQARVRVRSSAVLAKAA